MRCSPRATPGASQRAPRTEFMKGTRQPCLGREQPHDEVHIVPGVERTQGGQGLVQGVAWLCEGPRARLLGFESRAQFACKYPIRRRNAFGPMILPGGRFGLVRPGHVYSHREGLKRRPRRRRRLLKLGCELRCGRALGPWLRQHARVEGAAKQCCAAREKRQGSSHHLRQRIPRSTAAGKDNPIATAWPMVNCAHAP